MSEAKQFDISKKAVIAAFQAVKENAGSYGADEQTIKEFEEHLNNNLYKLWNRMASGSYFPKPVRAVAIPKKNGGIRILGIPTVEDRIAQMVAKMYFEPLVEPMFYNDSYGYRPNKSAIQAVGQARERCFKRDWVLELDIKGLFDNIKHGYLMYMVEKHTQIKWLITFTVEDTAKAQKIEMKDDVTKVEISKTDISGKELPGAKLTILDKDGKTVESWTSEEKPHYIEMLPIGEYTLREESAPDGYLVAEDVKFTVEDTGEIQKVVMKDEVKPEETPTPETPSTQVTDTPKTGDDTHMLIWILLAIAGMAGSVSAVWITKKRK